MRISPSHIFKNSRGFLVLDGVNGAGKSTLLEQIKQIVAQANRPMLSTREPGATAVGSTIRSLVLNSQERLSPEAELFLFAADRAEHVTKVIQPALQKKQIVLCDRYFYSTEAFQGYGRGLNLKAVQSANELAVKDCLPDLVVLLDLDPATGLRRTKSRGDSVTGRDSFEEEELAFHTRLRQGFLTIANQRPEPFLVVDASVSPEQVLAQVRPVIENWINSL